MSELSGNPEQVPYTPTTEEVSRVARILSMCPPEMCDGCDKRAQEAERLLKSRWLAEVKAEAWEDGALWHRYHELSHRLMRVRFLHDLEVSNPYRQGENK